MAQPNTAMQFSEREWDRLINMVLGGRVVPIIGPELLRIERDSQAEFLYDTWGRVLAEQAGLQIPTLDGTPLLYRVSNQLSFDQTRSFCDLAVDVDYVIRRQPWPMPAALAKLAQIDSFPLFITTTVDHLLERALQEGRPDLIRPARQISFRPGETPPRSICPKISKVIGIWWFSISLEPPVRTRMGSQAPRML
jgi:hypothetical protein